MKNFFKFGLIAAALVSAPVFADDGTDDGAAKNLTGTSGSVKFDGPRINKFVGSDTDYVVSDFNVQLSNNVELIFAQNRNAIAVATATPRGRNVFSGSSQGGSVATCGKATEGNNEPAAGAPSLDAADANGCGSTTNASKKGD